MTYDFRFGLGLRLRLDNKEIFAELCSKENDQNQNVAPNAMYFIVITMITTTTHKCIKGEESGGLKEYSYKPSEKVSFLKFHQLIELPQKNKKYSPSSEDSKMSDWC